MEKIMTINSEFRVTLVVVPRECFSLTIDSLESIYQNTDFPFKLIYVDGGSPKSIKCYLENQSQQKQFELIRTEHYLTPNMARNIGLKKVTTPYVVFIDNDVIVSKGWLEKLIDCAQETGSAITGPLTCQYKPVHKEIHFAGGEAHLFTDIKGRKRLREKMYKQGLQVEKLLPSLQRTETELCEFHCMLVRKDIFEKTGYLDEKMLNTKEHLDFCMTVRQLGEKVYFEPESIITYVPGILVQWADLIFYMLRWSDEWELETLKYLRHKWNLDEDMYFWNKYKSLGWRRRKTILQPFIDTVTFGMIKSRSLNKILMYGLLTPIEKTINKFLTNNYRRKWLEKSSISVNNFLSSLSYENSVN
jgi:GT2 family glycosyltransferase